MKNWKYVFYGLAFFFVAILVLRLFEPKMQLLSITQASGSRYPYIFEPPVNNIIGVQEVTLKKDYINGVEIEFGTMSRKNSNTNILIVLDSNYNTVYKEKFSSKDIIDAEFRSFSFAESKKIMKGNKIFLCLFSYDGDTGNCVRPLFNTSSKIGRLYASVLVNDDLINSLKNKTRLYPGSWILRTYESDIPLTPFRKWGCYLLAVLTSLVIIFYKQIQMILPKVKMNPEYIFPAVALIFGFLYVFLNPPFQVPDEGSHYCRSYELTDFQISNKGKTIPSSIGKLDSTLTRLHFNPEEKTSKKEILELAQVRLEPEKRRPSSGPDYIVPYIPQVLGFAVGRIFRANPLYLLYIGRIFNLLFSIVVIFYAIKIIPFSKWIFFLLALMPKTVYIMASLSYDAFVISSSFLLIALYLFYAFKHGKVLAWKDIGLLFFLSMLLALCKPPYFIIGFLFLIIPIRKIGSSLKYFLVFSVFLVSILLAQGLWSLVRGLIKSAEVVKSEQITADKLNTKDTISVSGHSQTVIPGKTDQTPSRENSASVGSTNKDNQQGKQMQNPKRFTINPGKQLNYIRAHQWEFFQLLIVTNIDHMRANMLDNFVGTMGWLDTFLPDTLINMYLILLLVAALCISDGAVNFDWKRKAFFLALFVSAILAIEIAMYIFSSYVGQPRLFGVQGRYFIPLAPLFLLIFCNNFIPEKLNYIFSPSRKSYLKAKPKLKPAILLKIQHEQIFTKYLQVFIIGFTILTLMRGIVSILLRYYEF